MSDRPVGGYGRSTPDPYDRPPIPSRPSWIAPTRPAEPSWMGAERESRTRPPIPSRPSWMAPTRPAEPSWMGAERESRTQPLQIAESSSARRPGPPPPPPGWLDNRHQNSRRHRSQQQNRSWYLTNQPPPRPLHSNGTITREFKDYLRREFDSQMPRRQWADGVRFTIEGSIVPAALRFHGINFEEGRRGSELFKNIYEESLGLEAGRPLTEQNTPANFIVRSRP
jgi:hypothetical protein